MTDQPRPQRSPAAATKEFITGIAIAFTMAFMFRGFAVEGFMIPTGSMAPTLLGEHLLVRDAHSGFAYTVNTPHPSRVQSGAVAFADPVTGQTNLDDGHGFAEPRRTRSGDRVFVMKYLRGLHEPARWDVIVFKYPISPQETYIKRCIGLPGEQLALIGGDVFARPAPATAETGTGEADWSAGDWRIQRKPERVQRALLQPVFDTAFAPSAEDRERINPPSRRYRPPFEPSSPAGWEGVRGGEQTWRYDGERPTRLDFDNDWGADARRAVLQTPGLRGGVPEVGALSDMTAYNQTWSPLRAYPVADVAVTLAIEPDAPGAGAAMELAARGMRLRARVGEGRAAVETRPAGDDAAAWRVLDEQPFDLPAGRLTNLEFWHIDQALWLFADGRLVAGGTKAGGYDMTPLARLGAELTVGVEAAVRTPSLIADGTRYERPALSLAFDGGPFTLRRVAVERDIHYQPMAGADMARGSHPFATPTIGDRHFFMAGDNSGNSLDARAWGHVSPWVSAAIHDADPPAFPADAVRHAGFVHRDLLIGRAFVVYLPAPYPGPPPMLDFGRMRWIW